LPAGLPDHDEALSGDILTSLFINYQWRRLMSDALQSYADSLIASLDDSLVDDYRNKFQALLSDLYTEDNLDGTPVGAIIHSFRDTTPFKWLWCDGATYTKVDYPDLWDAMPDDFKTATDFTLPDLRNQFLYGINTGSEIGDVGGEVNHQLTLAELPAHAHTILPHTHAFSWSTALSGANTRVQRTTVASTSALVNTDGGTLTTTELKGGLGSHNNMPPYTKARIIIKALP